MEGVKQSSAKVIGFKHNNMHDLEKILDRETRNKPTSYPYHLSFKSWSSRLGEMGEDCHIGGGNILDGGRVLSAERNGRSCGTSGMTWFLDQ